MVVPTFKESVCRVQISFFSEWVPYVEFIFFNNPLRNRI
ncbi:hypothetical protein LEP1GSC020_2629 [Leptospira interrogans serovar Grippotyphosa str. 2006006986]|nr:hypothetical protein LEP1GSC009_3101 [Leptospira interrogans serovar Grippotyphosa str. Andaman]EKP86627.1 hypothetical protein LEP1GSC020_2629 [Leptospira interrogans serovar Grippotyphosa str. 2006006986]